MKVILHQALSCDGFIATQSRNSNWVSSFDEKLFIQKAKKIGCVIVGRKTFEQYYGDMYPIENITNIVLSRKKPSKLRAIFASSPHTALAKAQKLGYKTVIVAGGGQTCGAFMKSRRVDEIFLTIHPIVLGSGIRWLEGPGSRRKYKLVSCKVIKGGLIHIHYKAS